MGITSSGVLTLQYYLAYISLFVPTVQEPAVDGSFGRDMEAAVISYQKTYGFEQDGIVDELLWNSIENTYYGILREIPYQFTAGVVLPYPGRVLRVGVEGEDVRALQEYLNYISETYAEIPKVNVDGVFGQSTAAQVRAFHEVFNIPGNPERVTAQAWNSIISGYDDLYEGNIVNDEQFPGYGI